MHKTTLRYWICQVLGWGGWALFNFFFIYLFAYDMYFKSGEKKKIFIAVLLIEFLCNILATHILRFGLKKIQWIKLSTTRVIILFIVSVILTEFLSYYGAKSAWQILVILLMIRIIPGILCIMRQHKVLKEAPAGTGTRKETGNMRTSIRAGFGMKLYFFLY